MNKILFTSLLITSICGLCTQAKAQLMQAKELYSKADSLRGQLTPLRSCYDIQYYHLDVKVDLDNKFISGSNLFKFKAVNDFNKLQFDLFDNLSVDKIVYHGNELLFTRDYNAVFVTFPKTIKKNQNDEFIVFYSGNPIQATRAPWDGGIDWKRDSNGKHFVATAVQGLGASAWWPNKDHQSDEPDSMLISVTVPKDLVNVSNGRLIKKEMFDDGHNKYHWLVTNPINNYNVSLNIGDYVTMQEKVKTEKGLLDVEYYILRENDTPTKKKHLNINVAQTLEALEYWFGPYPFFEDSYKIVETAHLGMEHQSAIAYGNNYQNGYRGFDSSNTGWGKKWDFIIVHESGHEWFGNNITAADIADMWIHESFTNYSEALFIDYHYGKEAGQAYVYGNRAGIKNDKPMQGPYHVNKEGSGDMYLKGGVFWNMIRTMVNDDTKWRSILRALNHHFRHKQVDYNDILNYISTHTSLNLDKVFEQYIQNKTIPVLDVKFNSNGDVLARWLTDVKDFHMPIHLGIEKNYKLIKLTDKYTKINIKGLSKANLSVDTYNYYINTKVQ
ncbi:M1 family metallopeptidase [Sphingobacterium bovistauri]|uniref:M1 family metallopeptidase n=1 Tax=Sphingobacterium bovistauri TaxID=2781959 RepID=A0ABS7Z3G7_9SPHI|nr:M1 family metallopeptidase [Sphingobacterium bovistauri]MCA5004693.1 M1 family metallopeptidase [Sphingobacterium bovistauri]